MPLKIKILFLIFAFHCTPLHSESLSYYLEAAKKHSPLLKSSSNRTEELYYRHKGQSVFTGNLNFFSKLNNIPSNSWPARDRTPMSGLVFGLAQDLALPWESFYRKKMSENLYLSQKEKESEILRLLEMKVIFGYHMLLFLFNKKKILIESKNALAYILALAQSLVRVNRMNSSQLLKIQADISLLENEIFEIEGNLARVFSEMNWLCGTELKHNFKDKEIKQWLKVSIDFQQTDFSPFLHPGYRKWKAKYIASKSALSLEKAKLFPGVKLEAAYTLRKEIEGMDKGENFISMGLTLPLPAYYPLKERYKLKEKKADLDAVKEEMKNIFNKLKFSFAGELANYHKLKKAFFNFKNEVKPNYFAAYQAQVSSLSSGTITLLNVLDTYRMYLNASMKEIALFKDLQYSMARLNYLKNSAEKKPGQKIPEQKKPDKKK